MEDVTLISVNWNQKEAMELLLKSYVKNHYEGEKLKLILVDNGSTDGSWEWLKENKIPCVRLSENIGHERAINFVYDEIKTKYALLTDTDVEFLDNVHNYIYYFNDSCKAAGELITGDNLGSPVKQRIGAWFFLWDIQAMKEKGVNIFRDESVTDWSYDVASWYTEQFFNAGFTHHNIERQTGHIDYDILGMRYGTHIHFGKVSWNLENHKDRITEVIARRNYIKERLHFYSDIDLRDKFI
jgi:glycosyltransferase involved in cell wall biosynthesis